MSVRTEFAMEEVRDMSDNETRSWTGWGSSTFNERNVD
jgi:hypothetical protein